MKLIRLRNGLMLRLNPLRRNPLHYSCTFRLNALQSSLFPTRAGASWRRTKVSPPLIFSKALACRWASTGITQSASLALQTPPRSVGYWLLSCSALVFGIIAVGGVTRLTESGLSITEWKPITGIAFPRTPGQWQDEFNKYSHSPEFKMSVSSYHINEPNTYQVIA